MNIHESLFSLLIIGMLSVDFAQSRVRTKDRMSMQEMGASVAKSLKEKCSTKFGSWKYKEIPPSMKRDCNETVVSLKEYWVESRLAESSGDLALPIETICGKISTVENCMTEVRDFFSVCLEPEEKEAFKIDYNIIVSALRFACHNGGDRLHQLSDDDTNECIKSKRAKLEDCRDDNVPGFFSISSGGIFNLTNHPLANQLQLPEKCSNLEKFKNCTVATLKTCPLPATANTFEALFTTVMKVTPCEKATMTDTTVKFDVEVEEPVTKALDEQAEAAEARVRVKTTRRKRAAFAQKHVAEILEQFGQTWLTNFAN